jgi:murein DD-endopeptidase MepM/ murein hydrolase activator NlpD
MFASKNAKNGINKYLLIARNIQTLEEKKIFVFRPKWLYWLTTFIVGSIMGLSFWMFNTIFSKFVNPLNYYNISSEKFTQIVDSLNELELSAKQNEQFVSLLQAMIAGKEVDIKDIYHTKNRETININHNHLEENKIAGLEKSKSTGNSNFVDSIHEHNSGHVSTSTTISYPKDLDRPGKAKDFESMGLVFLPPANGNILSHYMDNNTPYKNGVTIISPANTPICCIADGVVIFSEYVLNQNLYTTIIQHSKSIISVYRHYGKCLLSTGDVVHTGDVISIVNNATQKGEYNFVFELWIDFHRVNPEEHIIF